MYQINLFLNIHQKYKILQNTHTIRLIHLSVIFTNSVVDILNLFI